MNWTEETRERVTNTTTTRAHSEEKIGERGIKMIFGTADVRSLCVCT